MPQRGTGLSSSGRFREVGQVRNAVRAVGASDAAGDASPPPRQQYAVFRPPRRAPDAASVLESSPVERVFADSSVFLEQLGNTASPALNRVSFFTEGRSGHRPLADSPAPVVIRQARMRSRPDKQPALDGVPPVDWDRGTSCTDRSRGYRQGEFVRIVRLRSTTGGKVATTNKAKRIVQEPVATGPPDHHPNASDSPRYTQLLENASTNAATLNLPEAQRRITAGAVPSTRSPSSEAPACCACARARPGGHRRAVIKLRRVSEHGARRRRNPGRFPVHLQSAAACSAATASRKAANRRAMKPKTSVLRPLVAQCRRLPLAGCRSRPRPSPPAAAAPAGE